LALGKGNELTLPAPKSHKVLCINLFT